MTRLPKLDAAAAASAHQRVPAWDLRADRIAREFLFENFVDAFAFMTKVALLAEKRDHHPDWNNVFNRVSIELSTHDVGGLSELDFELAAAIDAVAAGER